MYLMQIQSPKNATVMMPYATPESTTQHTSLPSRRVKNACTITFTQLLCTPSSLPPSPEQTDGEARVSQLNHQLPPFQNSNSKPIPKKTPLPHQKECHTLSSICLCPRNLIRPRLVFVTTPLLLHPRRVIILLLCRTPLRRRHADSAALGLRFPLRLRLRRRDT